MEEPNWTKKGVGKQKRQPKKYFTGNYSQPEIQINKPEHGNLRQEFDLLDHFKLRPVTTFYFTAEDNSMHGIYVGDILVIHQCQPMSGDVILALLDGEYIVRRFRRKSKRLVYLESGVSKLIKLDEHSRFRVVGVARGCLREIL
ncbi:MAG: S24 family peptidase [Bacteroidota bacterium]